MAFLKDKSKVWGDIFDTISVKFAENNDIGEIVTWGLEMHENRHFLSYQKCRHDAENHVHICALRHSGESLQNG